MKVLATFPDYTESEVLLEDLLQKNPYTVLYFYPKDKTPGCTIEAVSFAKHYPDFVAHNAQVIGVSKDGFRSHCSFIEQYGLPFVLISDETFSLHNDERFHALGEKSMFGKKYMGTIRSTFILNTKGEVIKKWMNVSASGHVEEVLAYLAVITGL